MFLSSTAATELPVDIDIKAIKQLLDGFDPAALLPDIDTIVGKVQLVCTIAILIAPLVMLGMGLAYLFFAPKEANYYFGYRTAFGMGSVSAWRHTQRLAGLVFGILGLVLTILMLLIAMTLSARAPMDMAWLAAKCLLWQGILSLLAIAAINGITMYTYDYSGTRRRKKRSMRPIGFDFVINRRIFLRAENFYNIIVRLFRGFYFCRLQSFQSHHNIRGGFQFSFDYYF